MVKARPAAGGGRWVEISPERLKGWLDGFYGRHDGATEEALVLTGASNGDTAALHPPPGVVAENIDALLEGVARPPLIGLLLARRGAAAVGVADGTKLVDSKVERFYVQGRTAAGGWSQQRYARRRGNQTDAAIEDTAELAVRILGGRSDLAAVVCGGDRSMLDLVLADRRLEGVAALRHPHLLEVAEPRLTVLEEAAVTARKVRIHLVP
jgi:hypothetical protein